MATLYKCELSARYVSLCVGRCNIYYVRQQLLFSVCGLHLPVPLRQPAHCTTETDTELFEKKTNREVGGPQPSLVWQAKKLEDLAVQNSI